MSAALSTAMVVAAGELLQPHAANDERRAYLQAALLACGPCGRRLLGMTGHAAGRGTLAAAQWLMIPGLAEHYAWRKRHLQTYLHLALASGVTQIIGLGVGLDPTLDLLARDRPDLRVIACDRPPMLECRAMARRSLAITDAVEDLASDLSDPHANALHDAIDPQRQTLVIAEGVLMYLPLQQVRTLLTDVRHRIDAGLLIAATAMEMEGDGKPRFRAQRPWVDAWLARRGEPFQWGCNAADLATIAESIGMALLEYADAFDPRDPDPAVGEWVFLWRANPAACGSAQSLPSSSPR